MRRLLPCVISLSFVLSALVPFAADAAPRTLSAGLSGSDVTALQTALIAKKYLSGNATGYFGSQTLAAVKKYQCDTGIICSGSSYGIVGPKTQSALGLNYAGPVQPSSIGGTLTPAATGAFETSGWIPSWRAATGTADVLPHLNQMTSVMPFGFSVGSDGKLRDTAKINEEPWVSFIAAARAAKVRVIPTVLWGDGVAMDRVLSNAAQRIALEDEIANMVKQNGFDGVDIDFEAKQADTINYFSTFLKGLYQRMGSKWVYCAIEARMPIEDRYSPGAVIPPDADNYANDYAAINKYCDRVELMTYDQGTVDVRLNAARSAPYAPVADPGFVENVVNLAARSISRNKIIVGIPAYGYEYKVTSVSGGYQYQRLWAFNPGYGTQIATQMGVTPSRTSAGELGFTYTPNNVAVVGPGFAQTAEVQQDNFPTTSVAQNISSGGSANLALNYVTWSDAQAMKDKLDLAKKLGVRGVAVFSLGGAEDQGWWALLPPLR